LVGKVAAVTGAASGIGRAAAEAFAAEGARLALIDRQEGEIRSLAEFLGPSHLALPADVAIESQVAAAFATIEATHARLDILYNCAAIELVDADAPVDQLDLDTWRSTVETNLTGVFLCCKYGVRLMLKAGVGSIINCGSPTAISGRGSQYHAYSASKGGVHALTRAMAVSYGPFGIRVNCIVPGATRTPMNVRFFQDQEAVARLTGRSALRRLGEPKDLVGIALFLASDDSSFATGAMFIVDGGINVT
jgi:NAD(P)-dependent dehydrogenase (short-subunit alcohol dehydrogenase family)